MARLAVTVAGLLGAAERQVGLAPIVPAFT